MPAKGLLIFNTTTDEVQTNIGTPLVPLWSTTPVAGWNTTGNAGINPATSFIGTTDNQPLAIRTNNAEVVRVTADGMVGIGTAAPAVKLAVADTGAVGVRVTSTNVGRMTFQLGNRYHGIARNLANSGGMANDVALFTSSGGAGAAGALYLAANPYAGDSISLSQFTLKNNGKIGIGIKEPVTKLHLNEGALRISSSQVLDNPAIHIINDGGGGGNNDNFIIDSYGTALPSVSLRATRGSAAAPENITAGTILGNLYFSGRRDGTQTNMGLISATYLGDGINRKTRMIFVAGQETSIVIDSSSFVGIGTAAPTAKLSVNGTTNNLSGTWGIFSDARVKTIDADYKDGLATVMKIHPVKFHYNANAPFKSNEQQIGIIAQEMEAIAPYMVTKTKAEGFNDLRQYNNQALPYMLVNAIQEQQKMIENLKAALAVSKADNAALKADVSKISALAERMQRLEASLNTEAADNTAVSK